MDHKMSLVVWLFYFYKRSEATRFRPLVRFFYRVVSYWMFSIDLHPDVKVGKNLILYHGCALVVNPGTVLGDDVILRHSVTIGNKILKDGSLSGSPVIGDRVEFGCGAVCIGDIIIGDDVVIGANAVVTKSVPNRSVVVGSNEILR